MAKNKRNTDSVDDPEAQATSKKPRKSKFFAFRLGLETFMSHKARVKQLQRQNKKEAEKSKKKSKKSKKPRKPILALPKDFDKSVLQPVEYIGRHLFRGSDLYANIEGALKLGMVYEGWWQDAGSDHESESEEDDDDSDTDNSDTDDSDTDDSEESDSNDGKSATESGKEADIQMDHSDDEESIEEESEEESTKAEPKKPKEATANDRTRLLCIYHTIKKIMPDSEGILEELSDSVKHIKLLATAIRHYANQSRSDDSKKLKAAVLDYITPTTTPWRPMTKTDRGWLDPATAAAIVPLQLKDRWQEDPAKFFDDMKANEIKVKADLLPTCLFPHDAVWDVDNRDKDCFRSAAFLKSYERVFLQDPHGDTTSVRGRRTIAQLYGLEEVTGRTVAYVATLMRFSLGSQPKWSPSDMHFHLPTFYNNIVDMFEDLPDDPWVVDTLDFLNKFFFSSKNDKQVAADIVQQIPEPGSDFHDLRHQRRLRRDAHIKKLEAEAVANKENVETTLTPPPSDDNPPPPKTETPSSPKTGIPPSPKTGISPSPKRDGKPKADRKADRKVDTKKVNTKSDKPKKPKKPKKKP